jgi:hypothetical protein
MSMCELLFGVGRAAPDPITKGRRADAQQVSCAQAKGRTAVAYNVTLKRVG